MKNKVTQKNWKSKIFVKKESKKNRYSLKTSIKIKHFLSTYHVLDKYSDKFMTETYSYLAEFSFTLASIESKNNAKHVKKLMENRILHPRFFRKRKLFFN